ncbi:MAG: methylmalonyl-CoA mutase, partial [Pedobacter sp.]
KFTTQKEDPIPVFKIDDSIRQVQSEKLQALKSNRSHAKCDQCLQELNDRASSNENIMPSVLEAVENKCTLGEIADTLREVYGEYK